MARSFNGSTDKIAIAAGYVGVPGVDFTVAGWVYPTNVGSGFQSMMASNTGSGFDFQITNTTKLVAITLNAVSEIVHGATVLANNTWYQVAASYNHSTGLGTIYVNGATDNTNTNLQTFGSSGYQFGQNANFGPQAFSGRLQDFATWAAILSAGEILALFRGFHPVQIRPASISGYWPLEGLASPEPDFSSNAHNGTLTGTAFAAGPPLTNILPPSYLSVPEPPAFRKTFSPLGTRIFSRQASRW